MKTSLLIQIVFNDELGLIIYHNRFADTRGWIKTSAAYLDKGSGDLRQKSLAEGLSLPFEGFVIFKDYVTSFGIHPLVRGVVGKRIIC